MALKDTLGKLLNDAQKDQLRKLMDGAEKAGTRNDTLNKRANESVSRQLTSGTQSIVDRSGAQKTQFKAAQSRMEQTRKAADKRREQNTGYQSFQERVEESRKRIAAIRQKNAWQYKEDGTRKQFSELTTPEVLTWIGTLPETERAEAARQFETDYLKNPGSVRYDPYYTQYSNNREARELFGVETFDQEWIDANRGWYNYLTFSGEKYDSPKAPGKNATAEEQAAYLYWQIANTYEATTQAAENEYAQLRQEVQEKVKARQAAGEAVTADEIIAEINWEEDYKTLQNLRQTAQAGNARMLNRPVQVGEASIRSMVNAAIRGEDVTEDRDFLWDESQYIGRSGQENAEAEEEESADTDSWVPVEAGAKESADEAEEDLPLWWGLVAPGKKEDEKLVKPESETVGDHILNRETFESLQEPEYSGEMPEKPAVTLQPGAGRYSLNNPQAPAEEEKIETYADKVRQYEAESTHAVATAKVRKDVEQLQYALDVIPAGAERTAMQELLADAQAELNRLEDEEKQRREIEKKVIAEVEEEIGEPEFGREWVYKLAQKTVLNSAASVPTEDYEEYLRDHMGSGTGKNAAMDKYDYKVGENAATDRASLIVKGIAEGMDRAATAVTEGMEYVLYTLEKRSLSGRYSKEEIYAGNRYLSALRSWNAQFDREWVSEENETKLAEEYPAFSFVSQGISSMLEMMGTIAGGAGPFGPDRLTTAPGAMQMLSGIKAGGKAARLIGYLGRGAQNYVPFALSQYADGYEMAIEEGATEDQAAIAGALIGLFQGAASSYAVKGMGKLGGGLAKLFTGQIGRKAAQQGAVKAAKAGLGPAILSLVKTYGLAMLEEGGEEAFEEAFSGFAAKIIYDREREWTGAGGVLDWQKMAESGLAGAMGGVMFTTLAGLSGMAGETAEKETQRLLAKAASGERVTHKEQVRLDAIVERQMMIAEYAAQLEAEDATEVEAADKTAQAARENAEKAAKDEEAARKKTKETAAAAKPLMDALNEGTADYKDPETVKQIDEQHKAMKAAKEAEQEIADRAATALEEALNKETEAEAVRESIREKAREEATAQADEEIGKEREEAKKATAESAKVRGEAVRRALTEEVKPGVKRVTKAKLDQTQEGQIKLLDALAKRYGLEIDVVDTLGGKNAMYGKGRRIVVAADAMDGAIVQAGVHEMVHYVRGASEADYKALEAIVLQEIQKDEDFDLEREIAERVEQYAEMQELTREQAIEEIVAEAVPTVFTNEEAMRALVQRDASLAQRIRDWFVQFARRLRDIALDYAGSNARAEITAVADKADSLMEIAYALDDALMSVKERNEKTSRGTETGTEEVRYSTNISFEEQLRKLRAGEFPRNDHVYVMETPEVLQGVGLKKLPMLITQKHAKSVMKTSGPDKKANYHGLTITMMKQLPEAIANPVMIIKADGYDGRVIVITELKDDGGDTVIAPIEMNGEGTWQNVRIDANILTTAYGKSNLKDMLIFAVANDEVLYADKKRSDALGQSVGVQFPKSLTRNGSFIHSIADYQSKVNTDGRFSLNAGEDGRGGRVAYGPNQPTDGDGTYTSFRTGAEAQANAEEMRLDTDTDEFREWFKDSKVVDEKGEPLVMYHGTSGSGFTQFETYGSNYGLMGTGSYFTDNPEIAESYTKKGKGKKPGVYPVYLSIQKPADMDQKITATEAKAWTEYFGEYVLEGEIKAGQTREDALRAVETGFAQEGMTKAEAGDYVVQFLESQGYDGITHVGGGRAAKSDGTRHRVYIAFEPTQVKSATGNLGDFSAEDADIRYSANSGDGRERYEDEDGRLDKEAIREDAIMAGGEARRDDTQKSVGKIAGAAVREYKSTAARAVVIDGLNEMIEQYAENGDTEAAEAIADRVAAEIIGGSSRTTIEHREGYEATRKRLREKGVSLTDTQKQEVANWYGSYNDWRRSMMGSVKIRNDAPSLDAIWSELSDAHPEMFPADTQEAEMPEVLNRFVMQMKPQYVNAYGMDRNGAAAELSLKLQGEVLKVIGKEDQAEIAIRDAEKLRADYAAENDKRLGEEREKRVAAYREMANELMEARKSGNREAYMAAIQKYRDARGASIRMVQGANALAIGEQARTVRKEANRVSRIIGQLTDDIQHNEGDEDKQRVIDERSRYHEMLKNLQDNARVLHRMQAIAQAGMQPANDPETIEAEAALERLLREDMAEELAGNGVEETRQRVKAFNDRMAAKYKDWNMTSTATFEEIAKAFEDLEGEMTMQSEMVGVWRQRQETATAELSADNEELKALRRELKQAQKTGILQDVIETKARIADVKDRIAVSKSRIRQAEYSEQYARRCGAQSMAQALREGRLPQAVIERIVSISADAGRRGKINELLKSNEMTRLQFTTAARVWDDLFGEAAPLMRGIYYDPVMDNETEKVKWIAGWREKIGALKLTEQESYAVQAIGEGKTTPDEIGGMSAEQIAKVQGAVNLFRQFYEEAHRMATNALERNGYEKPGYITNYFPHISKAQGFFEKMGIHMQANALPTSINGVTETFTPGKKWSGHLQRRTGQKTDYDAVAGFEEYVRTIGDVIYHTDDIQRIRQLEGEIRAAAKHGVFGRGPDGHESTHLNEFVKWLHEYGNILAGKKHSFDRGGESALGRNLYAASDWLRRQKGASAVMGNIGSAVTNLVPLTQILGECGPQDVINAIKQMKLSGVAGESNIPESQFKIRRTGSDKLVTGAWNQFTRAAGKTAGYLFEKNDAIVTNIVVNSFYQRNLRMGMDNDAAMRQADDQAARLMGDRSTGAMPTIYASKIVGLVTQFQLEVANQSQHYRKDLLRQGGAKKLMAALITTSICGYIFNFITEQLAGRRPAIDPIDGAVDLYTAWKDGGEPLAIAQACYNNVSDVFPYSGGGRIAAFEAPAALLEAFREGDASDIGYYAKELAYSLTPGGGQIKKMGQGTKAIAQGGHYNASGTRLYYPLDLTAATLAQATVFGKSATPEARAYYDGKADALTEAQTRAFRANVERGMSPTEAYRNAIAVRDADRLDNSAKDAEKAAEDAAARERAEMEPMEYDAPDVSEVPGLREEAEKTREGVMPAGLSDNWYKKKDEPAVNNAILLWRMTGDENALPVEFTEEKAYTIDKRKEYLGAKLAKEANAMYEQGFARIMSGVNVEKLTDTQAAELIEALKDLDADIDKEMKKRIEDRG